MRKTLSYLLIVGILVSILAPSALAAGANISVYLNDQKLSFDTQPVIKDGVTLVPMRNVFESLGATVGWDPENKIITAYRGDRAMILTVGKRAAVINNEPINLSREPEIVNGRTLVPLRFVSEALGASVTWLNETREIIIKDAPKTPAAGTEDETVIYFDLD